jgi:ribosome-binding factor A
MKSQRQLQIGETIKRVMSDIFLRDDILCLGKSYITVLEADVSPDTKSVKIFIDIFGDDKMQDKIITKLNEAAPHFRYQMAKKITLRLVPQIVFVLDKTQQKAMNLEGLIDEEATRYNVLTFKPKKLSKKPGLRHKNKKS